MFKIFCVIVIITVTSYIGCYYSYALKKRLTILKKINYMIDEILTLIRFKAATVYEIVDVLKSSERFVNLEFLNNIYFDSNCSFQEKWCSAILKSPPQYINKSDIELLSDIGQKLGTSDMEGQISILKFQQTELLLSISDAEAEYNKKSKLYRSIGVLTGAFISIILI